MKSVRSLLFTVLAACVLAGPGNVVLRAAPAAVQRERVAFDAGWRFMRHDPPDANGRLDYPHLRDWIMATGADLTAAGMPARVRPDGNPGADVSYVQPGYDDGGWRSVDLPHDWAIEGPFEQELPGETAKLPFQGVGWYRKHFQLPAGFDGRRVALAIDGAMSYSAVWLNGRLVGGWPYGYTSYRLDLTPWLEPNGDNVLAIRLENLPMSSRWYPGAGLYRHVWLEITGGIRVRSGGVFVSTPRVSADEALVNVDVYAENLTEGKVAFGVRSRLFELDAGGQRGARPVAGCESIGLELDPVRAREGMRSNLLRVPQPRLWDPAAPQRYLVETVLERDGVVLDRVETPIGIRTAVFDPDRRLLLNGRPFRLNGVCLHHDLGALGTAVNTRAIERQLELLRAMGCNAIRTSHNPPAPELLELCDRMGMLVLDETFDAWHRGKKWPGNVKEDDPKVTYFDYARVADDWYERDLRAHIRRDRNHPSVILWSIGNEVIEQWFSDGWKWAARLAGIVREEDRTRPITSAFNNGEAGYTGFQTALDVVGFNYKPGEYQPFHRRHPTIPVFGSETAAMLSSRGEYFFPVTDQPADARVDFQASSYDVSTEWFFNAPDKEFRGLDEAPFALGEFVWTGFDYLGEPTPYNGDPSHLLNVSDPAAKARLEKELAELGRIRVPSRSSYFGILDLAGFPKDRYFLYQARWRPELPMVHVLPHWNWPGRVGQVTPVFAYTSGDEAELFLNGRSLGRKRRGPLEYRFRWNEVVYEPGEIRVVAYKAGAKWAEEIVRTTGPAAKLVASPDRSALSADGRDLSFVTIKVADRDGLTVPRSRNLIRFEVTGPAEIAAVDNGDPTSFEPFQASQRKAFNGLALVIVRTRAGQPGMITFRAFSDGLESATCDLRSR